MRADDIRDFFESIDAEPSPQFSVALLGRLEAEYRLDTSRDGDPATLEDEVVVIDLVDEQARKSPESRGPERPSGRPRRRRIALAAAAATALIIGAAVIVRTANDDRAKVPAGPGPVSTIPPRLPAPEGPPGASVSSVTAGGPGLVAVGSELTDRGEDGVVWTSADGTTWARVPDEEGVFGGPGIQRITDVTAGGPGLVAVGRGSNVVGSDTYPTAAVWTSADGFTWSRVPHDDAVFGGANGQLGDNFRMSAVTTGGPGLVAVGDRGGSSDSVEISGGYIAAGYSGVVWTSVDGTTWSRVPHDPNVFGKWNGQFGEMGASMHDVTAGGPGLVAVGLYGVSGGKGAVWTSADGISWTRAEEGIEAVFFSGVTAGGPGLVAVGAAVETPPMSMDPAVLMAAVWTSVDGTTWSRVPPQPEVLGGPGLQAMDSVHPGGPGLVAIGGSGVATAWTSADGITWSRVAHDSTLGVGSTLDSLLRLYGFAHQP